MKQLECLCRVAPSGTTLQDMTAVVTGAKKYSRLTTPQRIPTSSQPFHLQQAVATRRGEPVFAVVMLGERTMGREVPVFGESDSDALTDPDFVLSVTSICSRFQALRSPASVSFQVVPHRPADGVPVPCRSGSGCTDGRHRRHRCVRGPDSSPSLR